MTILYSPLTSFYHPTTVLFLDDNRAFLDVLELEFGSHERILTFTNQAEALQTIESSNENSIHTVLKTVDHTNSDTLNDFMVNLDLSKMLNLIYEKSRFEKISVVVVDYEMPE